MPPIAEHPLVPMKPQNSLRKKLVRARKTSICTDCEVGFPEHDQTLLKQLSKFSAYLFSRRTRLTASTRTAFFEIIVFFNACDPTVVGMPIEPLVLNAS